MSDQRRGKSEYREWIAGLNKPGKREPTEEERELLQRAKHREAIQPPFQGLEPMGRSTQGVARRLALPWPTLCRPVGAVQIVRCALNVTDPCFRLAWRGI